MAEAGESSESSRVFQANWFRARKTEFGKDLKEILRKLDDETTNIVRHGKEAAMKGLPVFLREDPNLLFKQCLETDPDDVAAKGVTVGILCPVCTYPEDHKYTFETRVPG